MTAKPWEMDIAMGGETFADYRDLVKVAVAADRAGIQNFWLTERLGRDAFALLAPIAAATENIGLGTGIVNTFGRTPAMMAQTTATLMEQMGDRPFNLGIGSSGKQLVEEFHGVPFATPMARLEEYIRILDSIFTTGKTPAGGTIFSTEEIRVHFELPDRKRLKIWVGSLTPRSIEITGKYADGWLPVWPSKSRGVEAVTHLEDAAAAAGRPTPEIAAYIYGVVSEREDLVQLLRGTLAWYIGANGVVYHNLFKRLGYEREADEIADLWHAGKRDEARHVVDQAMLEDTVMMGELPEFEAAADAFRAAGMTRPILRFPEGTSLEDTLAMLAKLERSA